MERERVKKEEVHKFIKLLRQLNEGQQAGLLLITDGLRIMADKQKSGYNR